MPDLILTVENVGITSSDAITEVVQVGEAVTQGMPVYQGTDGKWMKADCDDTAAKANVGGVTLTPASTDGYAVIARAGTINSGASLSVGTSYVLSGTAGGIAPSSDLATGDYITLIGIAVTSSLMRLSITPTGQQVP